MNDKKRVGIITLYFNYNFGALLQAYALQRTIRELGYDAEDIRYYREINGNSTYYLSPLKRILNKIKTSFKLLFNGRLFHQIYQNAMGKYLGINKKMQTRYMVFDSFIEENLNESANCYDGHKNISEAVKNYDVFVCGSDNIWNKAMLDTSFMLDFVPNDKLKIAYAPGMSTSELTQKQKEIISPCVNRIDYISCRESTGAKLLSSLTGKQVPVMLDPTLLLDSEKWSKIEKAPETEKPLPEEYIFCYILGDRTHVRKMALEMQKATSLPIVTIAHAGGMFEVLDKDFGDYRIYKAGPEEFVYMVHHSKYVYTDSFHGTVFSILFKKDFIAARRFFDKTRASLNFRIDNLLNQLNISKKRILDAENCDIKAILNTKIDWENANDNLVKLRDNSIAYLENALKDGDNRLEKEE